MHKVVCDGRPCRPGEGNLRGYEMWKQPYAPLDEKTLQGLSKKPIHGPRGDYYAELVQRGIERAKPGHFIAFAAADFDYRYFALNWHMSAKRAGLGSSAILYALDSPAYDFLAGHLGRAVVNGTATTEMWERTRLMRHIQRALAERHMAAGASLLGPLRHANGRPALVAPPALTARSLATKRLCARRCAAQSHCPLLACSQRRLWPAAWTCCCVTPPRCSWPIRVRRSSLHCTPRARTY